MSPEAELIDKPVGSPVADQVRVSKSRSVTVQTKPTVSPSALVWSPKSANSGATLTASTVQVKVSTSLLPPGSVTVNSTAYGEPDAAVWLMVPDTRPVAESIVTSGGRPVAE